MLVLKAVVSLGALILAFVLTFFFPSAGWESNVIAIASGIFGALGITSFRTTLDYAKNWFQSNTIVGSLVVVVPIIILSALPLFGIVMPAFAADVLQWVITGGGGQVLFGMIKASLETQPPPKI